MQSRRVAHGLQNSTAPVLQGPTPEPLAIVTIGRNPMNQLGRHSVITARKLPTAADATIIGRRDPLLRDPFVGAEMDIGRAIELPRDLVAVGEGAPGPARRHRHAPPTRGIDVIAASAQGRVVSTKEKQIYQCHVEFRAMSRRCSFLCWKNSTGKLLFSLPQSP